MIDPHRTRTNDAGTKSLFLSFKNQCSELVLPKKDHRKSEISHKAVTMRWRYFGKLVAPVCCLASCQEETMSLHFGGPVFIGTSRRVAYWPISAFRYRAVGRARSETI
jgi:hypothetical protein